jgi:hypothetical protein
MKIEADRVACRKIGTPDEKGHAPVRLSRADRRMADNDEIAEDYLK